MKPQFPNHTLPTRQTDISVFFVRQEANNIFRMSNLRMCLGLRLALQCNDLFIKFWLKGDEKQKLQFTK